MRALLIAAALATPAAGWAAGWTQPEGAYYVKLWGRSLVGWNAFDANGAAAELPGTFTDLALSVYGEYGLMEGLTLVAFGNPVGWTHYSEGTSAAYVGAQGLGVRIGRAVGALQVAGAFRYAYLPSSAAVGSGTLEGGEPFVLQAGVATNRIDGELQLGAPLSFGWWSAALGGRAFDGTSADGTPIDPAVIGFAQLGWQMSARWTTDLHFNLHQPLGAVEAVNVLGAGQTAYLGVGASGTWWFLPNWGLHMGFEGVVYAQSNAETPTLTLGFETRSED